MLRPHAGLMLDRKTYRIGLSYSKIWFPKGKINSGQWGVVWEIPLESLYAGNPYANQTIRFGDFPASIRATLGVSEENVALFYRRYIALQETSSQMTILGVDFRHYFNPNLFGLLETGGEIEGALNGYPYLRWQSAILGD